MKLQTRPDGLKHDPQSGVLFAPRARIKADPKQPRKNFPAAEIRELRHSIEEPRAIGGGLGKTGFDFPLTCRWDNDTLDANREPTPKSELILTDGERRFRATDDSWPLLPLILKDDSSEDAWDVALRSSLQKKLLSPVEEGNALAAFMERSGKGVFLTAKYFGLSEGYVKNRVYLRQCPKDVQAMVNAHEDTMSHALAFRAAGDKLPADDRQALIESVMEGMSLVDLKEEIEDRIKTKAAKADAKKPPDQHTAKKQKIAATKSGSSTSHGEESTSVTPHDAKSEVNDLIIEITGKIVALESFAESVDKKYFSEKVLPHIRRWQETLNRINH